MYSLKREKTTNSKQFKKAEAAAVIIPADAEGSSWVFLQLEKENAKVSWRDFDSWRERERGSAGWVGSHGTHSKTRGAGITGSAIQLYAY